MRGEDGAHVVTRCCLERVRRAEALVRDLGADLVVFTGHGAAGDTSEAEQMRQAWRGPAEIEAVVEPAATNTAENAARTLLLLVSRNVDEVVVVPGLVHLPRVRALFGPLYGRRAIRVRYVPVGCDLTVRAAVHELAAALLVPVHRRAAERIARGEPV